MTILIDYSQLAISCALVHKDDMKKGGNTKMMQDIIRHTTLKSILTYKKEYSSRFGKLVLCADSPNVWRKDVFPYYKAKRKSAKEESEFDWNTILSFVSELQHDISNVIGYKVVQADKAEGDDCIGIVAKYLQTNTEKTDNPLADMLGAPEEILIVSSDHDYKQLHKYKNVKQWSPIQKKWVKNDDKFFLENKIIEGDSGDGIPSVLMPDDWFVNGEGRAKSVTKSVRDRYLDLNQLTDDELLRYNRNKRLIDFDECPQSIQDKIVESYNKPVVKTKKQDIFNYLVKNRCRQLVDRIQEF